MKSLLIYSFALSLIMAMPACKSEVKETKEEDTDKVRMDAARDSVLKDEWLNTPKQDSAMTPSTGTGN